MIEPVKTTKKQKDFPAHLESATKAMNTLHGKHRHIHLLGNRKSTEEISHTLKSLGYKPVIFSTVKALRAHTSGREGGIIYCAPLNRSQILSVHTNLTKTLRFRDMNFFAVVPEWMNSSTEREMYKQGIPVVFEWPREAATFSKLFQDIMTLDPSMPRMEDTDKALEAAISTRLRAHAQKINPHLEISVYNGIVIARGNMKSIREKKTIVKQLKNTPGVRGVIDQSLFVGADILPGLVKKKANRCLRNEETIPDSTLEASVNPDESKITLSGSAASLKTTESAVRLLESFKGVEKVENRVNISPQTHARDLRLAKRCQNLVKKINIGSPHQVRVKIINGRAILKGATSSSILFHQMENAVRNMDGIKGVDNQMFIEPKATVNFY